MPKPWQLFNVFWNGAGSDGGTAGGSSGVGGSGGTSTTDSGATGTGTDAPAAGNAMGYSVGFNTSGGSGGSGPGTASSGTGGGATSTGSPAAAPAGWGGTAAAGGAATGGGGGTAAGGSASGPGGGGTAGGTASSENPYGFSPSDVLSQLFAFANPIGSANAGSLYGDPGSITGYMSPAQIQSLNQQLKQGQPGTPAFGNVSTAALMSTPPSNSLAALAAQLMGNTLGSNAPGGLASLGPGSGATMGYPAIEGVSPGVTAAPAGPSPGGTSVASNAPSADQAAAPSISPNAFAFADEGGAPQGANAATQAPSTVSSPTSTATQSPIGDMSGILQLVMSLMGDQGLGNLAQSAMVG